jgi:hypothetical protein
MSWQATAMTKTETLKAARKLWKEKKQQRRAEREREFAAKHLARGTMGVVYAVFPLPAEFDATRIGKDAVLFLRCSGLATLNAQLAMQQMGFKYKSCFVVPLACGPSDGFLFEAHALVLVGTRGKIPAPAPGTQFSSVIAEDAVRKMIGSYFPNVPTIWGDHDTTLEQRQ